MALITLKPSIPVLQSDTFEIQRQKINNLAADITTKLDAAPTSWIGYTYIKSIKWHYGYTDDSEPRLYITLDNKSMEPMKKGVNHTYKLFYDMSGPIHGYDHSSYAFPGSGAAYTGFKNLYPSLEPAQHWTVTYTNGDSENSNHFFLGNANVGSGGDKFTIEFALMDGRIATHSYTHKNIGTNYQGEPAGFKLIVSATAAALGKRALLVAPYYAERLTSNAESAYYRSQLFEDNFTITYS